MAIDQALFEAHAAGMGLPTIRVYRWEGQALTIGRLQDLDAARAAFPGVSCIRRPTGGRAVLHGSDLTITVVASEEILRPRPTARGVLASYHLLLQGVVQTVEDFGGRLVPGRNLRRENRSQDCFERVAACDLVDQATGVKALGAAQLRRRGAILQQVSLRPLQNVEILGAEFQRRLRHNFTEVLQVCGWRVENELTQEELRRASRIVENELLVSENSRRLPAS